MSRISVGIVDYGMGNHSSVMHSLRNVGCRVRVSADRKMLSCMDILVLPGVGAFPSAMQALHQHGLVEYLREQAREQRPILGICLGMQLLASVSHENFLTEGLDLIPGEVRPLTHSKWHIGWNALDCIRKDRLFKSSHGQLFYFNHSFTYHGSIDYQICVSHHAEQFPAVIRRDRIIGVQFHPEKSQGAGRQLLKNLVEGLVRV